MLVILSERVLPDGVIVDGKPGLTPAGGEHLPEEILLTEAFHRRFPGINPCGKPSLS